MTFTPASPGPARAQARADRLLAALGGLLAGFGGLAVAALVTVAVRPEAAPVPAVGGVVVDHTPAGVKEWAIRTFGESDKAVLQTGVLLLLVLLAAGLGVLAPRHRAAALAGVGVLGVVGALAAVTRPDSESWTDALPSLVGAATAAALLQFLIRRLVGTPTTAPAQARRRFLAAGAGTFVGALGATLLARSAGADRSTNATASRNALRLPRPASPAPAVPPGAQLPVDGISAFVTPNRDFYRVDTALVVPRIDADRWTLRIHGQGVARELTVTLRDLFRREVVERDITLNCVSNEVGGPYVGNARWLGVRLADLLREAGVRPPSAGGPADQLVARSVDGMTIGSPVETVMDGRDALLAFGMNGEPLPFAHGFPVRMLVPGLYGYVSACKWISSLELTTFAAYDAYWVPRGWSAQAPVKTQSRIDTPKDLGRPKAGTVAVAGVAWAQHRGIARVQVRVDDGPWEDAELGAQDSRDIWREWVYRWRAEPGRHTLTARATDGTGAAQTERRAGTMPDGATGLHSVTVTVEAAPGGAPARGARPGPSSTGRR
ncbi:molybdopterin-dependent oxidoreductase [Streptomyces showdoensis]|uniref:molybdopterin-dependent oxidoreductase n=1 Tax=Streptomyces showdoensis TaxID=68268 RepID=UPI000F50B579|nr:molybdopterin-dependent oxidoreductase [Streptomyces showdoensis]